MQYWINQNGVQAGPMSHDELAKMKIDQAKAWVWRSGLDDWVRITELPELADLFTQATQPAQEQAPQLPQQPDYSAYQPAPAEPAQQEQAAPAEEATVATPVDGETTAVAEPAASGDATTAENDEAEATSTATPPAIPQYGQPAMPQQPVQGGYAYGSVAAQQPQHSYSAAAQPQATVPQQSPTNMVWAILSTIFCCTIPGIVAIVYAVKTSGANASGNYTAAKHYSEVGAWWCIAAIVLAFATSPLYALLQLL